METIHYTITHLLKNKHLRCYFYKNTSGAKSAVWIMDKYYVL